MYRDAEERVQAWLDSGRRALLIYGARQVGKTWLIREMFQRNGISYAEINLLERPDILAQIKQIEDASVLAERLALYSDKPLQQGKSVIFLDEIQRYP